MKNTMTGINKKLIWISIAAIVIIAIVIYYFNSKKDTSVEGTVNSVAPATTLSVTEIQARIAEVEKQLEGVTLPVVLAKKPSLIYRAITTDQEKADFEIVLSKIPSLTEVVRHDLANNYNESRLAGKTHDQSIDDLEIYAEKY